MAQPELKDLLQAGVHFGHQTRRWNPKMRRFIFAERSGIYLIDLQKTLNQLKAAQDLMREIVLKGDNVLFVCTKRQLNMIVKSEAERCGAHWVTERWLGGTLTNFHTIKNQIRRLKELEQGQEEGAFEFFTKKEQLRFERERQKLNRNLEGIKNMGRLPGAMFVVDARKERIAIAEANKLGIPVVAIVDTNADPDLITVPVPGNDDAIRSVSLITGALVDVVAEARSQVPAREVAIDSESFTTYSTDTGEADSGDATSRRRPRRKRRPKPEAIAARLKAERPQEQKPAPEQEAAEQAETDGPAAQQESQEAPAAPQSETPEDSAPDKKKPKAKKKSGGAKRDRAEPDRDQEAQAEATASKAGTKERR
jgi:small subunit ribosomal protein S2